MLINLAEYKERKEAERERDLERKVIERWAGPQDGEHSYHTCRCEACKKRWDEC